MVQSLAVGGGEGEAGEERRGGEEREREGEGNSHTVIDAGTADWYVFAPTAWGGHLHSMGTCYRPMRTSESIHEGGERASEHLEEWISHGKLLRSTECGMFQNVGDTSAVQGYGTEPNTGWEGGMESGRIKH